MVAFELQLNRHVLTNQYLALFVNCFCDKDSYIIVQVVSKWADYLHDHPLTFPLALFGLIWAY